jgi:hypothetical protein
VIAGNAPEMFFGTGLTNNAVVALAMCLVTLVTTGVMVSQLIYYWRHKGD